MRCRQTGYAGKRLPYTLVEEEVGTALTAADEASAAVPSLVLGHDNVLGRDGRDGLVVEVQPPGAVGARDGDGVVSASGRVAVVVDDAEETVLHGLGRAFWWRDDLCKRQPKCAMAWIRRHSP